MSEFRRPTPSAELPFCLDCGCRHPIRTFKQLQEADRRDLCDREPVPLGGALGDLLRGLRRGG